MKTKLPQLKPITMDKLWNIVEKDKKFLKELRKQNKEIDKIIVQLKDMETINDQDFSQIC